VVAQPSVDSPSTVSRTKYDSIQEGAVSITVVVGSNHYILVLTMGINGHLDITS